MKASTNMKKLIILSITLLSCSQKDAEGETQLKELHAKLRQDSLNYQSLSKYLDWELGYKRLLYQQGYGLEDAQRIVDSEQVEIYKGITPMPFWYYDFRKQRDSNFYFPDSLVKNY